MKKAVSKRKFRTYEEALREDLQNPELATAYLNVALMDEDPRVFLLALKDVCEAYGIELSSVARKGKPTLSNFVSLVKATGISLSLTIPKK